MSRTVITTEDLSKYYRLGVIGGGTLREDLNRWWAKARGKPDPLLTTAMQNFDARKAGQIWALNGVNLEIKEGEILGIIGRNGAGKSTLLKILSRITAPTAGRATIRGRVGSLLEVGTGFHPELTGRENVFLNGAILGMTKVEISRKLDEIVEFAGLAKFIDTPVKRYSSGMSVRLAFSVAAHLEPEILIIDEVLAVGDVDFQAKCVGKMQDVNALGRTVLFVSHQLSLVSSICSRTILIDKGSVAFSGNTAEAILAYKGNGSRGRNVAYFDATQDVTIGDDKARLLAAWLENAKGEMLREFDIEEEFFICYEIELLERSKQPPYPNVHLFDSRGEYVFAAGDPRGRNIPLTNAGSYSLRCKIPGNLLNTGSYTAGVALTYVDNGVHVSFFEKDALEFVVKEDMSKRYGYGGHVPGPIRPALEWSIDRQDRP